MKGTRVLRRTVILKLGAFSLSVKRRESRGKALKMAVKAVLTHPYSNGPVEGLITKLKYIKRSLYGRGHFELLRQRFLNAA